MCPPTPKMSDKIYLTYKTRMYAESKYISRFHWAQVFICWYSFLIIVGSLAQLSKNLILPNSDVFFVCSSIAIFCISIYIYGADFSSKAREFRDCYLELQGLYQSEKSEEIKMRDYSQILLRYPNHTDNDYNEMLFSSWFSGSKLNDSVGEVKINKKALVYVFLKKIFIMLLFALLMIAPIYFLASAIQTVS